MEIDLFISCLLSELESTDSFMGLTTEEASKMLNLFKRKNQERVKRTYNSPYFNYEIVFKEGAINAIMAVKGIKTYAELARQLDVTRAYISLLRARKCGVSSLVICRVAALLNSTLDKWWVHYDIVPTGIYKSNAPVWNQDKHLGKQPYERFSHSAEIRKLDNPVEQHERNSE